MGNGIELKMNGGGGDNLRTNRVFFLFRSILLPPPPFLFKNLKLRHCDKHNFFFFLHSNNEFSGCKELFVLQFTSIILSVIKQLMNEKKPHIMSNIWFFFFFCYKLRNYEKNIEYQIFQKTSSNI